MTQALRAPVAAVAFLTRVPVGRRVTVRPSDVLAGAPLFPLVGGAIGLLCGVTADALAGPLPALVAGALAVGMSALLSGALHFDALADTADALGATDRERSLEIMRDHAIGTYGAMALIVVCLVDASVLAALAAEGEAAFVALGAAAAGRAAMLPLARLLPYARAGDGQGWVLDGLGTAGVVVGVALGCALAIPAGVAGLAGLGAVVVVALALGLASRAWLGGVTGDLLGTTAKLAETAFLVVALATL